MDESMDLVGDIVQLIMENADEIKEYPQEAEWDNGQLLAYVTCLHIIQDEYYASRAKIGLDFDIDERYLKGTGLQAPQRKRKRKWAAFCEDCRNALDYLAYCKDVRLCAPLCSLTRKDLSREALQRMYIEYKWGWVERCMEREQTAEQKEKMRAVQELLREMDRSGSRRQTRKNIKAMRRGTVSKSKQMETQNDPQ